MFRRIRFALPGLVLVLASWGAAGEIGFVEDFALARDRAASLRQLIPGTEDYYFFHALHFLNTEQFEKALAQLPPWNERFGRTPRLIEIETRHALLTYDRDPQKTLAYLKEKLGLRFDHERVVPGAAPNLPTALDPALVARAALRTRSLTGWPNLDNFEDSALEWLAAENLDWERRRQLLQRLSRPDVPDLPRLISEDLRAPRAGPFGSMPIHQRLTLEQLEALEKLQPALLNQQALVQAWIIRLRPNADEDWRRDPKLTRAYFDRLLAFARRLAPVHNPLKAHVLFHRLAFDRAQGNYDKALFLEYLKLPRQQPYMARALLESEAARRFPADLSADFSAATMMPIVGADEPLVRSYLLHFLTTAESPREFEPYINDVYLRHLFAEAKIVAGLGEPDQWAAQLPPELFRQLKERVDIDFAFTNKTHFAADEPVRLDVHLKNTPTLVVKVFEINTANYYRQHQREVDTDVNLDGLVPNEEKTQSLAEPPLRRVTQRFDFAQLSKPGIYVIDFIGGGKSSRAVIRKGRLRPLVTTGTAGLNVAVVDDAGKPVLDARLWLGGTEYMPDKDGTIVVPFSTNPGRRPIVLSRGDFSCLEFLDHPAEKYSLVAGIYVDREALLSRRIAKLIVRPALTLNGVPVSLKLLEEPKLRITSTDHDGTVSVAEVADFPLFEDRESTHEFRTPPRLARLDVALVAKVRSLSESTRVDLAAQQSFALNGIDRSDKIEDLHLARFGPDYVIEVRGRSGEPRAERPVQLTLKHRDFREPVRVSLKSDARGRIQLGPLPDIVSVAVKGPEGTEHLWPLIADRFSYSPVLHARAGESVTVPWIGGGKPARDEVALFELRDNAIRADRFDAVAVRDGLLELRGLPPGDYDLWLKRQGVRVRVRIVDGPAAFGFALGQRRHLELPLLKPVAIAAITPGDDALTIKLTDASKFARVHVFAVRYRPTFSAFDQFGQVRPAPLRGVLPAHAESAYLTGRNIGDEIRYVLDRRQQRRFPGNMAERPALLLNPWAVRSTETGEQLPTGGDQFAPQSPPAPAAPVPSPGAPTEGRVAAADGEFANLDFLADAAAVLTNLVPDAAGVVRIPRANLGPHSIIRVAAVDPLHTTVRTVTLPEAPAQVLDLRLRAGLDPKGHYTQQKQITVLRAGETLTLADALSSRLEGYDSLARVYSLYTALSRNPQLAEFAFILRWPKLSPAEKRSLYSQQACHELSFFLAKKDPEFFRAVIKPYLANKKDKTFLDHWLLEDDLSAYLEPWQFGRLNAVERVLLAQRIAEQRPKVERHLADLWRLQPPNADRFRQLFETAIQGDSLAADDRLELEKLKKTEQLGKPLMNAQDAAGRVLALPGAGGGVGGAPAESGRRGSGLQRTITGPAAGVPARDGADKKAAADSLNFLPESRMRANVRQLYRRVPPTQEWAENNYYKLPIQKQVADLVAVNPFWLDYVRHDPRQPFLSRNVAEASHSFTEMMLALAVLDLPFTAEKAIVKFDGPKMTYTTAGPSITFHEEVRPAGGAAPVVPVLVSQNFYRHGDQFRDVDGERVAKFITGEFVAQTVYGCQVVVTNPSPSRQRLTALIQVPVGALPVASAQFTRSVLVDLEPYRTQTIDYLFYFPFAGRFDHFPVHVAKDEALIASAAPVTFEVVDKPSKLDTTSWEYVSQNGSAEDVLNYLNRENLSALDLDKIAFRMRDKAFFEAALKLLRDRHVFAPTLWSYSIYHNVPAAIREFLADSDQLAAMCGGPIECTLVSYDPVARHVYEHLEYKPLVNARAHALGSRRQIVNDRFREQYDRFLTLLAHRRQLTDSDWLAVTYYLLLQDRIAEAMDAFARVNVERVATRLQYDYCAAYLAMFGPAPQEARSIALRYADHPVDRWRNAFADIRYQLDEAEGKAPQVADAGNRAQEQGRLAATEPTFEVALDGQNVLLTWQNLSAARVNFYVMDVEVLFSRSPFAQDFGGQFSTIRPNASQELALPAGQSRLTIPLPAELARRNVLVEVTAAGKSRSVPYYSNSMDLRLMESQGQLRAADRDGKPLPAVYVKVYARLADGQVKFHKDGYTDLRGRFDFASVSTPESQPITRFAILALSDDRGALIREVNPPQQ